MIKRLRIINLKRQDNKLKKNNKRLKVEIEFFYQNELNK